MAAPLQLSGSMKSLKPFKTMDEKKQIKVTFVPGDTAFLIYGGEIQVCEIMGLSLDEQYHPDEYYPKYQVRFWDGDTQIELGGREAYEDLNNDLVPVNNVIASSPNLLAEYLVRYYEFRQMFSRDLDDNSDEILPFPGIQETF